MTLDSNPVAAVAGPVLAWHFLSDAGLLRDGGTPPPDGSVLRHTGRVEICCSGLHASRSLLHALSYAPGATLCRVECSGSFDEVADKLVCTERRIMWRLDSQTMRRVFTWWAYWCADRAAANAANAAYAAYAAANAADAARAADAAFAAANAARAAFAAAYAATNAAYAATYAEERTAQEAELLRLIDLARGVA